MSRISHATLSAFDCIYGYAHVDAMRVQLSLIAHAGHATCLLFGKVLHAVTAESFNILVQSNRALDFFVLIDELQLRNLISEWLKNWKM